MGSDLKINIPLQQQLEAGSQSSQNSSNRDWEKEFWHQQNMQTVELEQAGNNSADKQHLLQQSAGTKVIQNTPTAVLIADSDAAEPLKASLKSECTLNKLNARKISQATQVYQKGLDLNQVKEELKAGKVEIAFTHKKATPEYDMYKTGMIQRKNKDVKIWTGKLPEQSNWKERLVSLFSLFGLNVVDVIVRGKKY